LADPCGAALILIIRVPARPSRLISRRSSLVHKRANSKIPGWLAICQSTTGVTTTAAALSSVEISFRTGDESNFCSNDGNCDTLGPWSDFIKEFGFVLPKPSKRIQSVTKMQMWARESRSAPFGGAT
jgi:hypothetical protein